MIGVLSRCIDSAEQSRRCGVCQVCDAEPDRSIVDCSRLRLRECMSECLSPAKSLNTDCVRLWPVYGVAFSGIVAAIGDARAPMFFCRKC
jgi:hypothetical protein